ncbi:Polysulfide reductase chain A [Mycolicibacterium vanbaalenii]|uniref:Polysulfide reductase chain A n=1 Tax=Mycolicibacterium vanbaalenii TaxID=110539 RepID=A0A5S9QME9_MYCVN|nr:molybdopterin-dependent oxidoreductase [Mycolicibacterium vanbaalenii]CAA0120184.1 Polysulfide reductase chain A [Mycolicibacterium vanbaalenii]
MSYTRPSICRLCHNGCAILVEVDNGKAVRVVGDRDNPVYAGYTCLKGRQLPLQHSHPDRLLHSLKRRPDGTFQPIPVEEAMDEIAERLARIIDRHGPGSVASYTGTMGYVGSAATGPVAEAFMDAIGSPMRFTPNTIDQPGKAIAKALHGMWMAPPHGFHEPRVALLIGANPLISHSAGAPAGNPRKWLKTAIARGLKLIVIDPRRTETARNAFIHLQPKPGHDISLLASMMRIIIDENLYDKDFVDDNVSGFDELRRVVDPFVPTEVARQADVMVEELIGAARLFAAAGRGYTIAGTGPNMSGRGTLLEYLILNLEALCGHYLRAGERVLNSLTFMQEQPPKAQAIPPFPGYGFGEQMRVRGLGMTLAGMPTAAVSDEILIDGEKQIHALFSIGGNPVAAWPDQLKTIDALNRLELLVQTDIKISATARLADYVIAPKVGLETPGISAVTELLKLTATGIGSAVANAQYTPAIVQPPDGADVVEDWELFYGLAQRLGLQLTLDKLVALPLSEAFPLDMKNRPTTDDLFDLMTRQARIPFAEIKGHVHGAAFTEPAVTVAAKDPDWPGRLELADAQMMADLREVAREQFDTEISQSATGFDFRLISRRMLHVYNSSARDLPGNDEFHYNPAFMHPADLNQLGLTPGDVVQIRSERSAILGVVQIDTSLRQGVISMTHAFGDAPQYDDALGQIGSPTGRLSANDRDYEPYSGQPRMSNIPVSVRGFTEVALN